MIFRLSSILDQVLEFKSGIHINPQNKGKFDKTKEETGETTEELEHSKNPKTRKRAVFAANAKKWHHGKNHKMSDTSRSISFERPLWANLAIVGAYANRGKIAAGTGLGAAYLLHKKFKKKKTDQGNGMVPGDCPGSSSELSARLDKILTFDSSDPRPRNNLGEFSPNETGEPDPNAMHLVYSAGKARGLHQGIVEGGVTGAAAGIAGTGAGLGLKALAQRIKATRVK